MHRKYLPSNTLAALWPITPEAFCLTHRARSRLRRAAGACPSHHQDGARGDEHSRLRQNLGFRGANPDRGGDQGARARSGRVDRPVHTSPQVACLSQEQLWKSQRSSWVPSWGGPSAIMAKISSTAARVLGVPLAESWSRVSLVRALDTFLPIISSTLRLNPATRSVLFFVPLIASITGTKVNIFFATTSALCSLFSKSRSEYGAISANVAKNRSPRLLALLPNVSTMAFATAHSSLPFIAPSWSWYSARNTAISALRKFPS